MSSPVRFRDHARRCLDRDVRDAYAALADDAASVAAFAALLAHVRACSSLLRPDGASRSRAVRALVHLARRHAEYRLDVATWPGGEGSEHVLVHALATHLLARYPVPRSMTSVWFGDDTPAVREAQRWWIAHGDGRPFRAIDGLPLQLTRKMERILIASPHHLPLRTAMRRAELLGLAAPPALVDAVLATDLADDLEHGEFWREVLHWWIHHWADLGPERIGPIVDFLYARRIRPVEVPTAAGPILKPPPEPDFSIAGRTPHSLQRLIDAWHLELRARRHSGRSWKTAGLAGFHFFEPPHGDAEAATWKIEELLHSSELRFEGGVLRHCVASYEPRCLRGTSSIWSLRYQTGESPTMSRYTIEVDPHTRRIVQIRGLRNARVTGLPQRIITLWAEQERLEVAAHA